MDKKPEECKEGAPEWMATYGDLVTLLMCFFVLLFAFSEIDAQKFEAVMESFQGSAGILSGGKTLSDGPFVFDAMPENDISKAVEEPVEDIEVLKEEVEKLLEAAGLESEVELELEARGLIIRFPDKVLFDSGKADLKTGALETLKALGETFNAEEFSEKLIRVEGHTDNVPINTVIYPSNWELSGARSANVVKYLQNASGVDPIRLSTTGYGEYRPIESNDTAAGRARNRRVDIVILRDLYEIQEPNQSEETSSDDAENDQSEETPSESTNE